MFKYFVLSAAALTVAAVSVVPEVKAGSTTLNWEEAQRNGRPALCRETSPTGRAREFTASVYTTTKAIYIGDQGYDVYSTPGAELPLSGRHTSGAPVVAQWGDGYVEVRQSEGQGLRTIYQCQARS